MENEYGGFELIFDEPGAAKTPGHDEHTDSSVAERDIQKINIEREIKLFNEFLRIQSTQPALIGWTLEELDAIRAPLLVQPCPHTEMLAGEVYRSEQA